MALNRNSWVIKRNALNETRISSMTLQQLRLFSVYLSCIKPRDERTATVTFTLSELQEITLSKKRGVSFYKDIIEQMLVKYVLHDQKDPTDEEGEGPMTAFVMFPRLDVNRDKKSGEWCFTLYPNPAAYPLLFNFRGHFFKYRLWNALNLKGKNQLRMYEILKQYENLGQRVISVDKLRELLGLEDEYQDYRDFNKLMGRCQTALAAYSDICFTVDVHSKKGHNIRELKFTITKNTNYVDPCGIATLVDLPKIDKEIALHEAAAAEEAAATLPTKAHGRYGRVKLTEPDYDHLTAMYGIKVTDDAAIALDLHMEAMDITFTNVCARLEKWIREDLAKAEKATGRKPKPKPSKLANFTQRETSTKDIEKLEREYIKSRLSE